MDEQKKQNKQAGLKLPQIQPNDNRLYSEQKQAQQQYQNIDNLQPLTHQKKKKKFHKRKVRKHSPEYYQKKKQTKLNRLKQKNWDSHFINDIIPQIMIKNKMKPKRTLSRLDNKRQPIDAIDPISNKTLNSDNKKEQNLCQVDKTDKIKKAKSFNIRVLNNQTQQINQNIQQNKKIKKQAQVIQKLKPHGKIQKHKIKKKSISTIKVQDDQYMIKQINKYQERINVLFQETNIGKLFSGLNKKNCYEIVDKQLVKLKGKSSQIFKIIQSIEKRQSQLEKITNQVKQKNDLSKISYQVVDNLRTSTLACIEKILKWKQKWQNNYLEIFQKQISFDLIYKVQNYLLTILKSTDQLLTNNSSLQNNAEAISQQKKQKNKNIKVKSKDPFLISIFGLEKESKQIVLKIRACQLLLLEEQYNSKKK